MTKFVDYNGEATTGAPTSYQPEAMAEIDALEAIEIANIRDFIADRISIIGDKDRALELISNQLERFELGIE